MKRLRTLTGLSALLVALNACGPAPTNIPAPPPSSTPTLTHSATPRPQVSATSTLTSMAVPSTTPTSGQTPEPGLVQASLALPEGAVAWQLPDAHIWEIAYSPDGRYLAVASWEVLIYRTDTLELWAKMPENHDMQSLAWSPDGQRLAGGSSDGMLWVWDVTTRDNHTSFKTDSESIDSLTWSPDGQLLAAQIVPVNGWGGLLRVWDAATGEESTKLDLGDNTYTRVAWSPDGTQLAGGYYGWVRLWNAATGEKQMILSGLPDMVTWVNSLAWSPDGRWLASGLGSSSETPQSLVVIYDPATGEKQHILAVPADPEQFHGVETDPGVYHQPWEVDAVAWSPDSRLLASGSYNGMLHIWDISTGEALVSLDNMGAGKSMAWSPDGKTLAIGTYEGLLILWDVSQLP